MSQEEQQIKNFPAGAIILQEGEVSDGVYVLLSGRVVISRRDDFGRNLVLAELSEGEVFGEMGLISHDPCSATVSTVGDVQVRFFNKKEFVQAMNDNFSSVESVLSTLFQRMRQMNLRVMELENQLEAQANQQGETKTKMVTFKSGNVTLSGQTEQAKHALGGVERLVIEKFPFQIGRWAAKKLKSSWFLGNDENDLDIHDIPPYGISRHHCHFERSKAGIFLVDESRLGIWVNGERLESRDGGAIKVALEPGAYTISLGSVESVFIFEVVVW
ncbi:MAG: cyclic nucleotide-binding domain-containing protein, partial [Mariprofundaceae bacterium]|nr:cyclic nucleotide-binding domain-containing protein [Mariprofundaceae bacterium]